ncbi:MAG TPA: hypothetical protein VJN18_20535 [Polyangiaceae bacterium]|nr:hypothetical protein [Polyangiaceae bacterium]
MTTRIGTGGPATGVSASASATRVTAPPGQPFKAVMNAGASAILSGAEQAVTRLPGGPILAAALRPSAAEVGPAQHPGAPVGQLSPEGATGAATEPGSASLGGEGESLAAALSEGANQNLFFIKLQERINAESRDYSAWSNILKARHDTVKNAIGNIR